MIKITLKLEINRLSIFLVLILCYLPLLEEGKIYIQHSITQSAMMVYNLGCTCISVGSNPFPGSIFQIYHAIYKNEVSVDSTGVHVYSFTIHSSPLLPT